MPRHEILADLDGARRWEMADGAGLICLDLFSEPGTHLRIGNLLGAFERAPRESWRSKFDSSHNVIVVNSGHRGFVYAARNKSLKRSLSDSAVFKGVGAEE